jgi:hypothetical protein
MQVDGLNSGILGGRSHGAQGNSVGGFIRLTDRGWPDFGRVGVAQLASAERKERVGAGCGGNFDAFAEEEFGNASC